jgi:hypothetical protein
MENSADNPGRDVSGCSDSREKKFACPFYKKDPNEFSICKEKGFEDTKGVIEHIREVHSIDAAPALEY